MMYDVTVVDVPHCNVQLRVVAHAPGPPRRTPCCARTGFGVDEISLPSEGPSACRPPFFPHTPLVFEGITSRAGRRMEHGSTTTAPQDGTLWWRHVFVSHQHAGCNLAFSTGTLRSDHAPRQLKPRGAPARETLADSSTRRRSKPSAPSTLVARPGRAPSTTT